MVYFSSNSDYFEDFIKFSCKNIKQYSITVKNLVFCRKFLENLIFPTDTPNGDKLSLEKGYFMKIYNISLKHIERDCICFKKLVFFLKQTVLHEKTSIGRRRSFENWLKSVISLKSAYFLKNSPIRG